MLTRLLPFVFAFLVTAAYAAEPPAGARLVCTGQSVAVAFQNPQAKSASVWAMDLQAHTDWLKANVVSFQRSGGDTVFFLEVTSPEGGSDGFRLTLRGMTAYASDMSPTSDQWETLDTLSCHSVSAD